MKDLIDQFLSALVKFVGSKKGFVMHFQQQIHVPSHPVAASVADPRCDICNFSNPSKGVVIQHIRDTHYGERYGQQNQVKGIIHEC